MTERVVAIVEARMGSTRLPGKSMRPVAGRPLVARVIERIGRARSLDEVVLATSTAVGDDVLARLGDEAGFRVFRGSESDVLGRILGAAHMAAATLHVQCWGDCPFADPSEVDRVVDTLRTSGADLAGNGLGPPIARRERLLPYGLDVLALRVTALERAERETRDSPYHREHGTTYIYQNPSLFTVQALETPPALAFPQLDLTINQQADYDFVCRIYDELYPVNPHFTIYDLFDHIRRSPELLSHPNAAGLR